MDNLSLQPDIINNKLPKNDMFLCVGSKLRKFSILSSDTYKPPTLSVNI